jgi:hypothetical protein
MTRRRGTVLLLVASSALSVPLAVSTNLAANLLPRSWSGNRAVVLVAVGLLWLATLAVALVEWRRSPGGDPDVDAGPERPRPRRASRNTLFQVGAHNTGVQVNLHGPEHGPPSTPAAPRDP